MAGKLYIYNKLKVETVYCTVHTCVVVYWFIF